MTLGWKGWGKNPWSYCPCCRPFLYHSRVRQMSPTGTRRQCGQGVQDSDSSVVYNTYISCRCLTPTEPGSWAGSSETYKATIIHAGAGTQVACVRYTNPPLRRLSSITKDNTHTLS